MNIIHQTMNAGSSSILIHNDAMPARTPARHARGLTDRTAGGGQREQAAKAAEEDARRLEAVLDTRADQLQKAWAGLHAQAALTADLQAAACLEAWPHERSMQVCMPASEPPRPAWP